MSRFRTGGFMHLVLLLVALNMAVCLLAGKAASVAERGTSAAFLPMTGQRQLQTENGGMELGRAARITPSEAKP